MIYQDVSKVVISVAPSVRSNKMCYATSDSLTGSYRDKMRNQLLVWATEKDV